MMPGVRFPAWLGRRKVANRRVRDASMESLGTLPFGRRMKRTLPSVQFRLLRCIFQGFLSASIDASEEVFVFPHLLPMSDV